MTTSYQPTEFSDFSNDNSFSSLDEAGGSIVIPLVDRVDEILPNNENLSKHYGRSGKLLARHRPRVVCALVVVAAVVIFGVSAVFVNFIVHSLRVRASGIDPAVFGPDARGRVKLANGEVVLDVVQPLGRMEDIGHALLLLSDPRFREYAPLSAEELSHGYLAWTAMADVKRMNFTLEHLERRVRADARADESTCVCFAAYGVPYNIVYLTDGDEVLYEPRVIQEFTDRVVKVVSQCALHALLSETQRRSDAAGTEPLPLHSDHERGVATNASGIVEYMKLTGTKSRRKLDLPGFPCVKHCVGFFAK